MRFQGPIFNKGPTLKSQKKPLLHIKWSMPLDKEYATAEILLRPLYGFSFEYIFLCIYFILANFFLLKRLSGDMLTNKQHIFFIIDINKSKTHKLSHLVFCMKYLQYDCELCR